MAHLLDDPEAGLGDATELVDSPMHRVGARGARSNDGYELHEPSGSAEARAGEDSLTTPLLVGEASHVAEKKLGRHRRRSAGPQTWTTSTSQPTSPLRGAGDARSMTPMPDRPATATSAASDAFSAQRLPRDSVVPPTPAPPLGAVIAGATAERVKRGSLQGDWLATQIPSYAHMSELLTCSDAPAIVPVDERRAMTHAELRELVYRTDADLKSWGVRTPGSRVGVAVPNGPELMSVLLCVMDRHTAVPVNPATTPAEMLAELRATGVVALAYQGGSETAPEMQKLCRELGIAPLAITPDAYVGGAFTLAGDPYRTDLGSPLPFHADDFDARAPLAPRSAALSTVSAPGLTGDESAGAAPKSPAAKSRTPAGGHAHYSSRVALVLHTSGSTGKKKVVPITTHQLVLGATAIAASSGLTANDVCLNFMPLFHVGGICRNLLAPLFAGGSTVAMPFFDVSDFWSVCVEKRCTWYYGAPTMHMLVVNSAFSEKANAASGGAPKTRVRFVANAAGPLLPSTAMQLREVFPGAAVLTSYGMTECMPITCPPPGYALERAGSSGQPICPDVAIVDDAGERVSNGRVAHIVVKGEIVTLGYENDPVATADSYFVKQDGNWFKTGDMGWMDADGYLYVTGRSKEVINRGGEIISPAEIEEALQSHPGVSDVVAISVPHATLQETVGVVVVPTRGIQEPGLRQLCQHASHRLPPSKWPQCLVLVDNIPRLATGKVSRSQIAKALDVAEISDGMSELDVTFEADLAATARSGRKSAATREEATERVAAALSKVPGVEDTAAVVDTTGSNVIIGAVTPAAVDAAKVMSYAARCLPGFLEPKDVIAVDVIPRKGDGSCDAQALLTLWKGQKSARGGGAPLTPVETAVVKAWADTLGVDARTVAADDDFFQVGGSSIVAGQFASDVRRALGANLTGADIFRYRTVAAIAAKIEKERAESGGGDDGKKGGLPPSMASKPLGSMAWTYHFSPTSAPSLMLQSLPLLVFAPLQKITRWCIFLNMWSFCIHGLHPSIDFVHYVSGHTFISHVVRFAGVDPENEHFHHLRLCAFFAALACTALVSTIAFPLAACAFKWCVLGRLKPGLHPLWGQYYLRWWLSNKALEVSGPGFFGLNDVTYRVFLRLMGARVGKGAKIGRHVRIADFDCLDVHANATVDDFAHLRAAEVRRGALRVAPVYVGPNATVCTRAIVGPGGSVPAGATLGPYMSWRELDTRGRGVAAQMEEHKKVARLRQPQPSMLSQALAWPLVIVAEAIVWIPWVVVFVVLIRSQGLYMSIPGEHDRGAGDAAVASSAEGVEFSANPAAYIKRWLGHYTGAEANGFDADSVMMPYQTMFIPHPAAAEGARAAGSGARRRALGWDAELPRGASAPELEVRRGAYSDAPSTLGNKKAKETKTSTETKTPPSASARDGKRLAPGKIVAGAASTAAASDDAGSVLEPVIFDRDGREVPDEEGGGSMPQGGQVHSFYYGDPLFEALDNMTWKDCITWFMDPFRLAVIFSARIGHNILGPLLQMAFVILVKRGLIGKFKPGPLPRGYLAREWELTRRWIMNKLLPSGNFRGAVGVIGKHYEYTSFVYRALGAKIGKRVFWPGSGVLVADGMYDLLEVGDDVVWGSRSLVFPADGQGALPVRIGAGGNVSDRCVLYAGATLCEDACLGSGAVAGRKSRFGVGSIWVGSRNGAAVMLDPGVKDAAGAAKADGRDDRDGLGSHPSGAPQREAKPFGRAVYQGKASYFLPPWQVMPLLFSGFIALRTAYSVVPIWVSWYVVAVITWDLGNNFWTEMAEWRYLLLLVFVYLWVHMMHTVARFVFDTGLKWIVIGRREPGLYPWDRSSYCLRWKIFESLCSDTLHDLKFLGGSAFLPFFYNNMGSKIGRRVCLYPTGADPPMVEPDLVVIEDGVAINFAHIICHTNTLGSFALNHIVIKSGATLSTESRIMGGVVIGEDAVLLEHTMAMVGDVVEPGDIWQGWPVQAIAKAEDVAAAAAHSEAEGVTKREAIAKNAKPPVVVAPLAPKKAAEASKKTYGTY